MKTAEDWANDELAECCDDSFCFDEHSATEVVKRIQLDAIKHGMTLSADTIHKMPVKTKHIQAASDLTQAILTARDNLKEIPK